ncbi:hypothetical protein [Shinella sp.]|uniref:DUF6894 family protein n=1 Tax=Shinella sp. TaxID=1870904 RepID=UPI00301BDC58
MPRYFFHIRSSDRFETDPEGAEFETLDKAIEDARMAAREIMSEKVLLGEELDGQRFEITTEDGVVAATVLFRSALRFS